MSVALLLSDCGGGSKACPGLSESPLLVTVLDATTGVALCDATVTAKANGQTLRPVLRGGEASCFYELDRADSGTYSVTASASGYRDSSTQAVLTSDDCGNYQSTDAITIQLNAD